MSAPPPPPPPEPGPEDDERPQTRGLGVGMMVAAWVMVLGLLALPFYNLLEEQRNPNRDPQTRFGPGGVPEVTLARNRLGHYVASGTINNRRVTFLVDTGATVVSVSGPLARDLGLRRGHPITLQTANGPRTGYTTRLEEVRLGDITLHDVPAVINTGPGMDEVLLGMSFLKQLEFSQHGDQLTLRGRSAATR